MQTFATAIVLSDISVERQKQNKKWGVQNHPDGTGQMPGLADVYRTRCEENFRTGNGTWQDILLEEVYEALAESDPQKLREELIQVAAVAVAWVEAIDRREGDNA